MAKKSAVARVTTGTPVRKTPQAPATRRTFLAGIDPVKLLELLEATESPSYLLYAELRARFLEPDMEAVQFAAVLDVVDVAGVVEGAIRQAGFVVGFECCRQLLLGELEIPTLLLKGGAK